MKKRLLAALLGVLTLPLHAAPQDLPWLASAIHQSLDSSGSFVAAWSKKGAAVVLAPIDGGGRGGSAVHLLLIDTVEDAVLAEADLWSDEFEDTDDSASLAVAMAASPAVTGFLERCLDVNVIPLEAPVPTRPFPLVYQGVSYAAKAVTVPRSGKDEWGSRALDFRIVVSQAKGEKTAASGKQEHAFEVSVDGYFLSPWEPRMVVVYSYTSPGFEGEHPRTVLFSGSHLTAGFKKASAP